MIKKQNKHRLDNNILGEHLLGLKKKALEMTRHNSFVIYGFFFFLSFFYYQSQIYKHLWGKLLHLTCSLALCMTL